MRLTRGADYGARGIIYLARQPMNAVVLVGEIASAEELSESYLAKIFQDLAKEGLVRSHRGAKGGFSLARPPESITLRQVIEAIEGPIAINRCLAPWEGCERSDTCPVYPVLARAQEQLLAVLDGATLRDLADFDPQHSAQD
jgi:Rrf2 family transcriptional regulator, iron-sulfur cluster assembly transcription factor